jgi:hypothetical protein
MYPLNPNRANRNATTNDDGIPSLLFLVLEPERNRPRVVFIAYIVQPTILANLVAFMFRSLEEKKSAPTH